MDYSGPSPWEISPYYEAPKVTIVQLNGTTVTQLIGANPMRTHLLIAPDVGGSTAILGPTNQIAGGGLNATKGIEVTTSIGYLTIDWEIWGPIVQSAWYGVLSGPGTPNVLVVESTMRDWPDPSKPANRILGAEQPKPPPPTLDTGPGVNGSQGILSKWLAIVRRITGR